MRKHPRLWGYAVLPVILNLFLTVLLLAGLVYGAIWGFGWVDAWVADVWYEELLEIPGKVLIVLLVIALTIAAWIVLQGILCGYFYSELAKKVELIIGMRPEKIREVPLVYQVVDALLDLTWLVVVAMACFVIGFVPIFGPVAALVIGVYFDCYVFGMDYLDYPQALRYRGRKVQLAFARSHRAHTVGLGASVMILSLVPILNAIFLTTAAVGAVLLFRRIEPTAADGDGPAPSVSVAGGG